MKKIKASALPEKAVVGIVAPASPVLSKADFEAAKSVLIKFGYQVALGQAPLFADSYLAGEDDQRSLDLENFWRAESICAIWALRGGYGCLRLLSHLNYAVFAKKPKILVGFSDLTALELALWQRLQLVSFHGPVLTTLESDFSQHCAFQMISGSMGLTELPWPQLNDEYPLVIHPGEAEGILLGGNLATICSMIGSGYLPSFYGTLLFIEEVGEAAYRLDRELTQLLLAGVFRGVRAVLIGRSVPVAGEREEDLIRVFTERLKDLDCPVGYGFPIGHLKEQWTLPQGVTAGVDMVSGRVWLKEAPVEVKF